MDARLGPMLRWAKIQSTLCPFELASTTFNFGEGSTCCQDDFLNVSGLVSSLLQRLHKPVPSGSSVSQRPKPGNAEEGAGEQRSVGVS
jgi:hypothetical protein